MYSKIVGLIRECRVNIVYGGIFAQKVCRYVVIKYLNRSHQEARERESRERAGRYFYPSRLRRGCGFSFCCFVMVAVTHLGVGCGMEYKCWYKSHRQD